MGNNFVQKMLHPEPKSVAAFKDEHPNFVTEVIVPIIVSLTLMFSVWKLFSIQNVLMTVPFTSMFIRYSKYRPSEWPILRMVFLSLFLIFLAWAAGLSLLGAVLINFITVYYLVFFFTNTKTDRIYFEYVYIYITAEAVNGTIQVPIGRAETTLWCCFLVTLFLIINNMILRRSLVPDFDFRVLIPLDHFSNQKKALMERHMRAYKSLFYLIGKPKEKEKAYFKSHKSFRYHKTRFAMRTGLLVSFCFFIARLLKTPMHTVLPLLVFLMILPYYDASLNKIYTKIKGNIAAMLIAFILTSIFSTQFDLICLVVLFVVISKCYMTEFQETLCSVTVALVVNSLSQDTHTLLQLRIFYILIAVVIAYLGNKFLYPNPKFGEIDY